MNIGVIGYRRHALNHINYASKTFGFENIKIFHPYKKIKGLTNEFQSLLNCDCIIISSPTNTHLFYIKKLISNNYKGYIYLEKPGFSSLEESFELEKLQLENNLNITIGYHYPYEKKIKRILEILDEQNTGEIISLDIKIAKGISYSKWFKEDWRNKDKLAIAHTVLSHAISIFYFLTNSNDDKQIKTKVFYNHKNKTFDNSLAISSDKKPLLKAIASWGSPLIDDRLDIITTNSLISLENNILTVRAPRETFNSEGLFSTPNISLSEKFQTKGIEPSLESFFEACNKKSLFNKNIFKQSLSIGRLCFSSEIVY